MEKSKACEICGDRPGIASSKHLPNYADENGVGPWVCESWAAAEHAEWLKQTGGTHYKPSADLDCCPV